MPNGVDLPQGRATDDMVQEINSSYDIPEGIPLFLFVGRLMKYKGLPIIVDAMKILAEKGINYRMVFVGGGADAQEMQDLVKAYGIDNKVIFTGPIHDREKLRAWNTRADLFLFPSTYDTNGIVVREAAACGLASVLIKDSCAAEGITHDRNGYLIEENSQSMAELLEAISGDLARIHQVGQNAMDEIYISWDQGTRLAYDRYKEIREMVKEGELGVRKHQSFEYLMNSAATILNGSQRVFVDIPKDIGSEMREGYRDFKDEVIDNYNEIRDGMLENYQDFRDEIKSGYEEFKDNLRDNYQEFKDGVESLKKGINDGIDKIKDNFSEDYSDDKYDDN